MSLIGTKYTLVWGWAGQAIVVLLLLLYAQVAHASTMERVRRWEPVVVQECERVGIEPCPIEETLALVWTESGGDPKRRKSASSQFYGLLQIGAAAAAEAGLASAEQLHGNGRLSIRAHLRIRKRYSRRLKWAGHLGIALLWKAGPGALRKIRERGGALEEDIAAVAQELGLGAVVEYLRRYERALAKLEEVTPC